MSTHHGSLSPQALKRVSGGDLILEGYDNDDITCLHRKHGSGKPMVVRSPLIRLEIPLTGSGDKMKKQ